MIRPLNRPLILFTALAIGAFAASGCESADGTTGSGGSGGDVSTDASGSGDGSGSAGGDSAGSAGDTVTSSDAIEDDVQGPITGPDVDDPTPDVDDPTPDVDDPTPDVDDPTPDVDDPTPDVDDPTPDVDDPTPDVVDPGPDADLPVEDVVEPLCVPGTIACDDNWIVVCAPSGEEWTAIIECSDGGQCHDGACCEPSCDGAVCGDDGCGGSCGECGDGMACAEGACVCAPSCEGNDCGDDGCGGSCGECAEGDNCEAGLCVCPPQCDGAMCGNDGCGGSCGECAADNVCTEGVCVGPCPPGETRCNGETVEVCNPDGENWTAVATCSEEASCFDGACCTPNCDGAICGDDGCGGSCGTCDDGDICSESQCWPACDEPGVTGCDGDTVTMCSAAGIEEPLIACQELGQVCEDGGCVEPVIPPAECPEVCVGASVEAALCALDICYEDFLEGAEISSPTGSDITGAWEAMEQYGTPGNNLTPQAPPSYLALASGDLYDLTHQSQLPGTTATPDLFSTDGYDIHDSVEFTLTLTAPPGVTGFSLDSLFMSVEYEEWIGTNFNDKLYLIVNAEQSTGGEAKVINYAACSNPEIYYDFENDEGKWCYIAINAAYSEPCSDWTTDMAGTGFSCPEGSTTGWLRTTHPIEPGEAFTLTLHIHDTTDAVYDSAALFDNFQWLLGEVVHETIPIAAANCVVACGDKVCGDDGCGGSCGECEEGTFCSADGECGAGLECEEDNPQGCVPGDCPEGQVCDTEPTGSECIPSSCACDPATGGWICTEDCGAGLCIDAEVNTDWTGIHIEVTWDTPGDPDQTDEGPEAGSDLDLHFTHPYATGNDGLGWFDQPFDVFWFNTAPNWGSIDPTINDDPNMLLDDTDGWGPEIIEFSAPQDDLANPYRVGVHYWADHGFGISIATVKIWIDGVLVDPMSTVLEKGDMWEVATIDWPSGTVTPLLTASGQATVISDYESPFFPSP